MAKSDMEDTCDSPGVADGRKSITDVDENWLDKNEKRIHSGQFMVSCVQDPEEGRVSSTDELLDAEVVDPKGFDFGEAVQEPTPTYQFGGHAEPIDGSLTKLFECMTLAYRSVEWVGHCPGWDPGHGSLKGNPVYTIKLIN